VIANGVPGKVKTGRLQRQTDFQRLYQHGQRARGKLLTLVMLPRPEEPHCRAAYVVSRKVSLKAVGRNLVRRRLREALRTLRQEQDLDGPADLILIAAPAAAAATYAQLRDELQTLLSRLHLRRPPGPE
jgi:ribonuclease P protein component